MISTAFRETLSTSFKYDTLSLTRCGAFIIGSLWFMFGPKNTILDCRVMVALFGFIILTSSFSLLGIGFQYEKILFSYATRGKIIEEQNPSLISSTTFTDLNHLESSWNIPRVFFRLFPVIVVYICTAVAVVSLFTKTAPWLSILLTFFSAIILAISLNLYFKAFKKLQLQGIKATLQ